MWSKRVEFSTRFYLIYIYMRDVFMLGLFHAVLFICINLLFS